MGEPKDTVQVDGDMLTVRPTQMAVGVPVTFAYLGVRLVAVKRPNGTVEFYVGGSLHDER